MFEITSKSDRIEIEITRGDSALFHITTYNPDGSEYEYQPGDVVEFTVKQQATAYESEPLIHKYGPDIKLDPEDTKGLQFMPYVFDVQITQANGDVSTIIGPSTSRQTIFKVLPEVTP